MLGDEKPRKSKTRKIKSGPKATDTDNFKCLVRASCTKTTHSSDSQRKDNDRAKKEKVITKISTIITSKDVVKFDSTLTTLQKVAMDKLKKKEKVKVRKSSKKTIKKSG